MTIRIKSKRDIVSAQEVGAENLKLVRGKVINEGRRSSCKALRKQESVACARSDERIAVEKIAAKVINDLIVRYRCSTRIYKRSRAGIPGRVEQVYEQQDEGCSRQVAKDAKRKRESRFVCVRLY